MSDATGMKSSGNSPSPTSSPIHQPGPRSTMDLVERTLLPSDLQEFGNEAVDFLHHQQQPQEVPQALVRNLCYRIIRLVSGDVGAFPPGPSGRAVLSLSVVVLQYCTYETFVSHDFEPCSYNELIVNTGS